MKQLNFIFIIQGEGRGHMTQAISIYNMLQKVGHKVSCVMIGINPQAECKGLVSTAGFESVCEAKYMGKPVLMAPVVGIMSNIAMLMMRVKRGQGYVTIHLI